MSITGQTVRQVSTFAGVGVAATLTHVAVAWIVHALGAAPQPANFAGWVAAFVVSFLDVVAESCIVEFYHTSLNTLNLSNNLHPVFCLQMI